jgi:hypothetical protein
MNVNLAESGPAHSGWKKKGESLRDSAAKRVPGDSRKIMMIRQSNKRNSASTQAVLVIDGKTVTFSQCENCGRRVAHRYKNRRFCGDRCRKQAARAEQLRTGIGGDTRLSANAQKTTAKTVVSNPKKAGGSVPLNLLGGYRFPTAPVLETALVTTILETEARLVRHEVVRLRPAKKAAGDTPVGTSDWAPSPNCNPNECPEIPPFLQRDPTGNLKYPDLIADESDEVAA